MKSIKKGQYYYWPKNKPTRFVLSFSELLHLRILIKNFSDTERDQYENPFSITEIYGVVFIRFSGCFLIETSRKELKIKNSGTICRYQNKRIGKNIWK